MISTLALVADGWTFVQSRLLWTHHLIDAASARGFKLRSEHLASLTHQKLLVPFLAVHDTPVGEPLAIAPGPRHHYARHDVDFAAIEGRLADPAVQPLPDGWRFDQAKVDDEPRWWNGLAYSRWQLLQFADLVNCFTMAGHPLLQDGNWPAANERGRRSATKSRDLAILLSAIESRYYPLVDEGWVRLQNSTHEEWDAYRASFDPVETARQLGVTGPELVRIAERILVRANALDPLGSWSRVIRQAPPKHQDKLHGLPLLAVDLRRAAEMLLLFAEDLGAPSPPLGTIVAAPVDGRISRHGESLESALRAVGVSPHTRVALIVEGATEVIFARKILEYFDYGANPDGLQVISMEGVTKKERIQKLAAHLVTPIITGTRADSYDTLRPLCQVVVVTDPEGPMTRPDVFRQGILRIVREDLKAQGVDDVDPESLDFLVGVHTLEQSFEYEHFTDEQIAAAILELDPSRVLAGQVRDVAKVRAESQNLKKILGRLSKTRLAEKLWPIMRDQIDAARRDQTQLPPFADIVHTAHSMAVDAMNRTWILSRNTDEDPSVGDASS